MQRERPLFNSYLLDLFRRPSFESPMPLDSFQTLLSLLSFHPKSLDCGHHSTFTLSCQPVSARVWGQGATSFLDTELKQHWRLLFDPISLPYPSCWVCTPAGKKLLHLSATPHIHTPVVSRIMSHSYYFCLSFLNNIFELGKEHRINRLCKWK